MMDYINAGMRMANCNLQSSIRTVSTKARSLTEMNLYIQIKDPDLWEEIRKACYPTFFEEKKMFGF